MSGSYLFTACLIKALPNTSFVFFCCQQILLLKPFIEIPHIANILQMFRHFLKCCQPLSETFVCHFDVDIVPIVFSHVDYDSEIDYTTLIFKWRIPIAELQIHGPHYQFTSRCFNTCSINIFGCSIRILMKHQLSNN